MQNNRGFTLIELMVTIAVLAIIAMIAAPNMRNAIDKRQIEGVAADFEKVLVVARSDAVLSRKKITIHLGLSGKDTVTDRYWNIPEDVTLIFNEGVCRDGKWSFSIIGALSIVEFLPQGNVTTLPTNLEIQLKRNSLNRFIYLTNFGRISSSTKSVFKGDCE